MSAAAISATFSDWRTVKGRKQLQLIFEVPLEQQGEILSYLGAPVPDDPRWVAIALLNTGPVKAEMKGGLQAPALPPAGQAQGHKSDGIPCKATVVYDDRTDVVHGTIPAKQVKGEGEWAVQRAGILCGELKFQFWISGRPMADTCRSAVEYVHKYCGVTSRREFLTNPAARSKFLTLDTDYRMATGGMAEVR